MAIYKKTFKGDFYKTKNYIDDLIMKSYKTARLEDSVVKTNNETRVWYSVYEIYSFWANNRFTLSLLLMDQEEDIYLNMTTSGASGLIYSKIDTYSEDKVLENLALKINEHIKEK